MQKKVLIELSVDEEYLSVIHKSVGEIVEYIEDTVFRVDNVKVEDVPRLPLGPTPRYRDGDQITMNTRVDDDLVTREVDNAVRRSRRSGW